MVTGDFKIVFICYGDMLPRSAKSGVSPEGGKSSTYSSPPRKLDRSFVGSKNVKTHTRKLEKLMTGLKVSAAVMLYGSSILAGALIKTLGD